MLRKLDLRQTRGNGGDESFGELAGSAPDTGDEAAADLLSDLANAETTRDLTELREIEAAAVRIRDGSYGLCADCGIEIPLGRLLVKPEAVRCIACQSVHEKTVPPTVEVGLAISLPAVFPVLEPDAGGLERDRRCE